MASASASVHQFQPRFNEHALLDDPEMLAAVTAINKQIGELAPVLNGPHVPGLASVHSSQPDVPIDLTVRRYGDTIYVFAVAMRNAPIRGRFEIKSQSPRSTADVIGEHRRIAIKEGRFEDEFQPYDVHLYAIANG